MSVSVVAFSREAHFDQTVQVLLRVRDADPTYPSPVDVDRGVTSFAQWLMREAVIERWVAVVEERVVGHVAIAEPNDYILSFLARTEPAGIGAREICEIEKLFVDPIARGHGVGKALLGHAMSAARQLSRIPALAVVADSRAARRLYLRSSLRELGTFEGVHGTNHVFMGPLLDADSTRK